MLKLSKEKIEKVCVCVRERERERDSSHRTVKVLYGLGQVRLGQA